MSIESVRAFLAERAPDIAIVVTEASSATVPEAAAAHAVEPARIAKTLALAIGDRVVLVVARGDARLDNKKIRSTFGGKAKMPDAETVTALTGPPVGGVCPFGLATPLPVHCDVSLRSFDVVVPAAGATDAAVFIAPERLAALTDATWVDVCQVPAQRSEG